MVRKKSRVGEKEEREKKIGQKKKKTVWENEEQIIDREQKLKFSKSHIVYNWLL